MKLTYIIVDDDAQSSLKTQAVASRFQNLHYVATASNYSDGINLILEHQPKIVFLEIDPSDKESNLSLHFINELHRFLKTIPKIIVTTKYKDLAYEALKYEVFDYVTKPLGINEFRKTLLKLEKNCQFEEKDVKQKFGLLEEAISEETFAISKVETKSKIVTDSFFELETIAPTIENVEEESEITTNHENLEIAPDFTPKKDKPLIVCVKSYGDYRFIEAKDICYLQADNNSTDIHLHNGEMITAFKTLKHFENVLQSPFVRIHNSYIVNIDYVSRIHTGNAVCYIKHTTTKLPFSKSYKDNVDSIISSITNGNYLEI
jgi:DNA-binding LytR/AlgR family response regulator